MCTDPHWYRFLWNLAVLAAVVWLITTNAPAALIGYLLALLPRQLSAAKRS